MVINLWGLDKYGIKHTESQKNLQEKMGVTCKQTITDRKYMRSKIYEIYTFESPNISFLRTNFIITKAYLY